MNALEIIEKVREYDAELFLQDDRLLVHGRGDRLPEELRAALREHRMGVMAALGVPIDRCVLSTAVERIEQIRKEKRGR